MKNEDMMKFLEGTELTEETKVAICKLIQANNEQLKKDMPGVDKKDWESYKNRRGAR
ncbi:MULTISPECIES: hypothetical protein [unclassified Sporosarcina]|uniref:hypothetical protein n=1 Tax=unclassified Sporosarcina TaxID=2647733 RepID=UPI00203D075C|nr:MULTISPECIES: hypothetical protein [unclassified Sporosarcina]GKV67291.1 hypothetical protein NCCP2331_34440 [Sporosarcina sp. NCCP-2331]GLB57648.1 hypothetical protein NCCP2378_34380 [Sporosarcina sp. NCCP-2378]